MILDKNSIVYKEAVACWNYFFDGFSRKEISYGLMVDKYPHDAHKSSIAATGFFLASLVAASELSFTNRASVEKIALRTLDTLAKLDGSEGFFYHFYSTDDLSRLYHCELSTIDTALLIAGAICAGEYFGGETKRKAQYLYDRINWNSFIDVEKGHFHMAKYDNGFHAYWDVSAEQLILYVLAGGASNEAYRMDSKYYYNFRRLYGRYGDYNFIYGWFGSLFTHQFSHAFVDFTNLVDRNGTNWQENSRIATQANRQFCIDNKAQHVGYGENSWGLTACATPKGYEGRIGAEPSGNGNIEHVSNGTVAPAGAIGSIVFCPELSISAMEHYYSIPNLFGKYGFTDAFCADLNWVSKEYISIDKGISLLMIANYYNNCITKAFGNSKKIKNSLEYLGFRSNVKEV